MTTSQIALVTGANRGIGLEVSRQLAAAGYTVLLTARDLSKAEQAAHSIQGEVHPYQLDVTNETSIQALYQRVQTEFNRLDGLINNAAILYDTFQNAVNADLNVVQQALETNTYGPWRMIQTFLPLMRRSQHGRIVNVSSGAGALSSMGGGTPAYSMSKVALNALTCMVAAELRGNGILVNAVCPGWVATDMGGRGGRSVRDGAAGIVWAATLPDNGPTGGFFRDRIRIEW